jgi:hypothetical protein
MRRRSQPSAQVAGWRYSPGAARSALGGALGRCPRPLAWALDLPRWCDIGNFPTCAGIVHFAAVLQLQLLCWAVLCST